MIGRKEKYISKEIERQLERERMRERERVRVYYRASRKKIWVLPAYSVCTCTHHLNTEKKICLKLVILDKVLQKTPSFVFCSLQNSKHCQLQKF